VHFRGSKLCSPRTTRLAATGMLQYIQIDWVDTALPVQSPCCNPNPNPNPTRPDYLQVFRWRDAAAKLASGRQAEVDAFAELLRASSASGEAADTLDLLFDSPGLGRLLLQYASGSEVSACSQAASASTWHHDVTVAQSVASTGCVTLSVPAESPARAEPCTGSGRTMMQVKLLMI
jgi:hypothetical protein